MDASDEIRAFLHDWPQQRERWRRLQQWEDEQLFSHPVDLAQTLGWMSAARDLACRYDPEWGSAEDAREHWEHLAEIQRRLGQARLQP